MDWYYAEAGKPVGPLNEMDFRTRVAAGTIRPDTMVWREGMQAWLPFSNLRAPVPPTPAQSTPADNPIESSAPAAHAIVHTPGERTLNPPAREGSGASRLVYASMASRFIAKFIDGALLYVLLAFIPIPVCKFLDYPFDNLIRDMTDLSNAKATQASLESIMSVYLLSFTIWFLLFFALSVFFVGTYGGTPGKRALGLRIVHPDGSPVSYRQAAGMFFADILDIMTLGLGYIMACADPERRTLRDRICNTRVIRKT